MNLLDILEENKNIILTEAIKIDNAEEAYDLIKNKQIGVKVEPSWTNILNQNLIKSDKNKILSLLNKAIDTGGKNKVFTIQLIVNKVPVNDFITKMNFDSLKEIVSCKNKPWAKEIPGYKEIINLNGKKYNQKEWHNMEKKLQEEGMKHGKHNKGSGEIKDVKNIYDDGIWTLQIPTSFEGEKAISFYGKKGEKQIPTEWCTRTEIYWYNQYTENNKLPLYVIRNWETGKSYQMAIRDHHFDFLDQNDVDGDKITKGDLTEIPDELLYKINYKGRSPLEFKKLKEESSKKIIKQNTKKDIKDPTLNIEHARWGNPIKINNEIIKQVWENFAIKRKGSSMYDYMTTGEYREPDYHVKHNGHYAIKYYYKKYPDMFVLWIREPGNNSINFYWKNKDPMTKSEIPINHCYSVDSFIKNNPDIITKEEAEKLYNIAYKDSGRYKTDERAYNKIKEIETMENSYNSLAKNFSNNIRNSVNSVLRKYNLENVKLSIKNVNNQIYKLGAFMPKEFELTFKRNGKKSLLSFSKDLKGGYKEDTYNKNGFENMFNDINTNNFIKDIEYSIKSNLIQYYKKELKNKNLTRMRNEYKYENYLNSNSKEKSTSERLQFENYFPY